MFTAITISLNFIKMYLHDRLTFEMTYLKRN